MAASKKPHDYTPELAEKILQRLADGESLRTICDDPTMPYRRYVRGWRETVEGFNARYLRAREEGAQAIADEALNIADTPQEGKIVSDKTSLLTGHERTETSKEMIEHRRLQVSTRQWYLAKLDPKRFGEKLALEHSGEISIAERLRSARRRVGTE